MCEQNSIKSSRWNIFKHFWFFIFLPVCLAANSRRRWSRQSPRLLSTRPSRLSWKRPDDGPHIWSSSSWSGLQSAGRWLLCAESWKIYGLWPRARSRGWPRATERLSRARQSWPAWRAHWPCCIYERWSDAVPHSHIGHCISMSHVFKKSPSFFYQRNCYIICLICPNLWCHSNFRKQVGIFIRVCVEYDVLTVVMCYVFNFRVLWGHSVSGLAPCPHLTIQELHTCWS